jgi:hypothetical protein
MAILPGMHPATSHAYLQLLMEHCYIASERCGRRGGCGWAVPPKTRWGERLAARQNQFGGGWVIRTSSLTFYAADIHTSASYFAKFLLYTSSCLIITCLQTQSSKLCNKPSLGWFPSHHPSFHPQPRRLQALNSRLLRTLQDHIAQI